MSLVAILLGKFIRPKPQIQDRSPKGRTLDAKERYKAAFDGKVRTSRYLADQIGVMQKSADRCLRNYEARGFVKRAGTQKNSNAVLWTWIED